MTIRRNHLDETSILNAASQFLVGYNQCDSCFAGILYGTWNGIRMLSGSIYTMLGTPK